jgi:DinB superfamily
MLDQLRTWPVEQLRLAPDPQAWSPLQILEHLILTEHVVLEMMQAHRASPHRITIAGQLRSALVVTAMLLPTRVGVPDAAQAVVPANMPPSLTELVERWASERREFAEFLSSLSATEAAQGLCRHPYGGWTSAHGALLFLRSHLYHHRRQIARIRRPYGASAARTVR